MTLKTASVLAFDRKLNNSDALFYSGRWDDRSNGTEWPGIVVREKSVRGTISNRLKTALASDPAKLDTEVQKANLQTVDAASLPANHDTLKVAFTLRVIGGVAHPSACNSAEYEAALRETIDSYLQNHQCSEQALRYASNLASGRFLWRNRVGAENIDVVIDIGDDTYTFDGFERSMDDFGNASADTKSVGEKIQMGLMGTSSTLLRVTAYVKLGDGQEVFPSQELVQEKQSTKSKHLYHVSDTAAMHSQKIGNAIRTIDTWHDHGDEVGAIAVEPYGSVTSRGVAYRQPAKKLDFYTLLDGWVIKGKVPDIEQQHYVVATLIRGGVFGEAN